jgi:hypothetical protein
MEHILDPTASFDFSQLTFVSPTSLSGGTYFIRMLTSSGQNPFYNRVFSNLGKNFYVI